MEHIVEAKTVRVFERVAGALERRGLCSLPGAQRLIPSLRRRYFGEVYDQSTEAVLVRLNGINLEVPRQFIHHYVFRDYEQLTRRIFLDLLRPGMTVVDVGAHIGYYSVLAAKKVGKSGRVHAFEPCPESAGFTRRNIRLNELDNVKVHQLAVGDRRCSRMFNITGSSDSHGFYKHPNTPTLATLEVSQVPLDDVVDRTPGVVKIDVEGAETEVLQGMNRMLASSSELTVIAEWFPAGLKSAGYDPFDLPRKLEALGFSSIRVLDDHADSITSVEEISRRLSSLPTHWYSNLLAQRR